MWFWIILLLVLSLVDIGVWIYIVIDTEKMREKTRDILDLEENIETSLEEFYEETIVPMEKYYHDNLSESNIHEKEES